MGLEYSSPSGIGSDDWRRSFGIYQLDQQLFDDLWKNAEILLKNFRIGTIVNSVAGVNRHPSPSAR